MSFDEYYKKFEQMQGFIVNDLMRSTVYGRANFLVAMGAFNYMEQLGAFLFTQKGDRNEKRFMYVFGGHKVDEQGNLIYGPFEGLLGIPYVNVRHMLSKITPKSPYDVFRCGLTHEYLLKTHNPNPGVSVLFQIVGADSALSYSHIVTSRDCGIEITETDVGIFTIKIWNPRLIHDLNGAFNRYKDDLLKFEGLRSAFMKRCDEVEFGIFS